MTREEQRFHAAVTVLQSLIAKDISNEQKFDFLIEMKGDVGKMLAKLTHVKAKTAILYADALLAELDRTAPKPKAEVSGTVELPPQCAPGHHIPRTHGRMVYCDRCGVKL